MYFILNKKYHILFLYCFLRYFSEANDGDKEVVRKHTNVTHKSSHGVSVSSVSLNAIANLAPKWNISEDVHLNFTQLARKYGYECEEFDVITEDKYILQVFHIPGNKSKPVLYAHGFLGTADSYIIRGDKSIAIASAKRGYDSWFLNVRGNKYSKRHVTLNPKKDNKFWNFSFHEFGVKDLPAAIDFVLSKTNQTQLSLVGFSQGNQISFILLSMKQEYNKKVKLLIALAPVAFLNHLPKPTSYLKMVLPVIKKHCLDKKLDEVFQNDTLWNEIPRVFCSESRVNAKICEDGFIFPMAGPDPAEIEPEFFPVLINHFPSSTSRNNFAHMVQLQYQKRFCQFDHGPIGNLQAYGSLVPPDYPLTNITTPVALLAGLNDRLADIADVILLREKLQNRLFHVMKRAKMNHFDFIFGKDMDDYLFPILFDLLKNHTKIFNSKH